MRKPQRLLKSFLAREIELDELQRRFAQLLEDDSDLATSAAAWLDAGEQDGLLSSAVCTSLKNVLISHMAARDAGPNPRDSGLFDSLEELGEKSQDSQREERQPYPMESKETFVREPQTTVMGTESASETSEAPIEPIVDKQSAKAGARLTVGSVIGERYELLSQLGSGGMGSVFKAYDRLRAEAQDRNPYVALKILSERFKEHPDSMIALQREVRRAQTLAHPNVGTVHEFFRDGPHIYMTMELLDGKPLDHLLETVYSNGLTVDQAWPIIEGVGRALEYGHKKGIVHSDIKPGNIFVCDDGAVKVLDLGISRPMPVADLPDSEQTLFDPGKRLGSLTPAYASLEMWSQDTPDPRDDIYALACVSYLLFTGRHPFDGQSAKKAYENKLSPKRVEHISRGQWMALSKGLELRRGDRIGSITRFLSQLDPQSVVRSKRRIALLLATGTAAILAAVGLRYYGLFVEDRAMDDRGRMQLPRALPPATRPALTSKQQDDIENLMILAELQFQSVNDQSSADDLTYYLSFGPNNVIQLADTVLEIDPGSEAALTMKKRVFDLYLTKARELREEEEYDMAMSLTRNADAVMPNTSTVLRLQRSICGTAPAVCVGQ